MARRSKEELTEIRQAFDELAEKLEMPSLVREVVFKTLLRKKVTAKLLRTNTDYLLNLLEEQRCQREQNLK